MQCLEDRYVVLFLFFFTGAFLELSLNEIKLIARPVYYEHQCGVKGYFLLKENQETGDTDKMPDGDKFLQDLIILHKTRCH